MRLRNPILPGFHPDPSVCRVGEDYYLANSSFEYFPGVPIYHSRNLADWQLIGHALDRPTQLPLAGAAPSDGIYAPTLRHHRGTFYLATTNHFTGCGFRNFYVTATHPAGPWSDPIWVAQGGIDPSLFFDDDGTVYWTGNGTGWADVRGIYQSVIDPATGRLQGSPRLIWTGTGGSYPEGPHLFKRGGLYYLVIAEGGTAEAHMATIARAPTPFGPFEGCPQNPILTHRSLMNSITSTGHADLFEDHHGAWWAVFLGIRYSEHGYNPLGRETFLAPVEWDEAGWPVVHGGRKIPELLEVPRDFSASTPATPSVRDHFSGHALRPEWVYLRNPTAGSATLDAAGLRLRCAGPTLDEIASPAALFRRQQHFEFTARARVEFAPTPVGEEAGLTILLDHRHHAEIVVTTRDGRRVALLRRRIGTVQTEESLTPIPAGPVELTLRGDRQRYTFSLTAASEPARTLGHHEVRYVTSAVAGGYTGAMIGLFATARGNSSATAARFAWFDYEPAGHSSS